MSSTPSSSTSSSTNTPSPFIHHQQVVLCEMIDILSHYDYVAIRVPELLAKLPPEDPDAILLERYWSPYCVHLEELRYKQKAHAGALRFYLFYEQRSDAEDSAMVSKIEDAEKDFKTFEGFFKRKMAPLLALVNRMGSKTESSSEKTTGSEETSTKNPNTLDSESVAPSGGGEENNRNSKQRLIAYGVILVAGCILLGWAIYAFCGSGTGGGALDLSNRTSTTHAPFGTSEDGTVEPTYGTDEPTFSSEETTFGPEEPTFGPDDFTYSLKDLTYGPDNPTYGPDDPTYGPEYPTKDPEDPTYGPKDPIYDPEDPTNDPEDPTNDPEDPTYDPEDPTYDPEDPTYGPEDPSYDLEDPNYGPYDPPLFPKGPSPSKTQSRLHDRSLYYPPEEENPHALLHETKPNQDSGLFTTIHTVGFTASLLIALLVTVPVVALGILAYYHLAEEDTTTYRTRTGDQDLEAGGFKTESRRPKIGTFNPRTPRLSSVY